MGERMGQRLVLLGLLGVLIGALGFAYARAGGEAADSTPDGERRDDGPTEVVALELAGPYDGLDSLGHPVAAEPDTGLIEGQTVVVHGSGFSPDAQVGIAQCRFRVDTEGQNDCDLGNIAFASTDANGDFEGSFVVTRYVAAASGTFDCVDSVLDDGCGLGVGNLSDYDDSGSARIFFDAEAAGQVPPRVAVSETSGLVDGQELVVTGSGFVPGELAHLTQCPVGGAVGIGGCYGENQVGTIEIDGDGSFAVSVPALRLVRAGGAEVDCFTSPYQCLLIVQATRMANTVPLTYDGGVALPRDTEYTITPSTGLADGQTVALELFDVPSSGPLTIEQCVDQGPLGVSCGAPTMAEATAGDASASVVVERVLVNAEGDEVDCSGPSRTCFLRVRADDLDPFDLPIHFAPAE